MSLKNSLLLLLCLSLPWVLQGAEDPAPLELRLDAKYQKGVIGVKGHSPWTVPVMLEFRLFKESRSLLGPKSVSIDRIVATMAGSKQQSSTARGVGHCG